MAGPATQRLSYAEYLALERQTDTRHQFIDGNAYAMAGGSVRHSALKSRVMIRLGSQLDGSPCLPLDSDAKVRLVFSADATYPDFAIVCGGVERHPEDRHAFTNPTLLAEVLSPTTEKWDRGGKFSLYRTLPSLCFYLLISTETELVELYTRNDDETWTLSVHAPGDTLRIDALDLSVDVSDLYDGIPDEPTQDPPTL